MEKCVISLKAKDEHCFNDRPEYLCFLWPGQASEEMTVTAVKKKKKKITYNGTLFHIIFFFFKDGHMHILNSSFQNHST